MSVMQINELKSEEEWASVWFLLAQLRENWSSEEFIKNYSQLLNGGYRLFCMEDDGKKVACAGIAPSAHLRVGQDWWITDLVTDADCRSKGYGQRLVEHIIKIAQDEGWKRVCLSTRESNERAKSFYEEKVGFKSWATVYVKDIA